MASRKVLVVGATGKQGGAVIDALLTLPPSSPPIHILGLTRNPESAKAKTITEAHPGAITFVKGDFKAAEPVFAAHPDIASLFLVTVPGGEDVVGKVWIDAAIAHGVQQIVLSTVDRGGERSWDNPTQVPHFYEKHAYEVHLRDRAEELAKDGKKKLYWTILRPTAFMDNFNPGMFGRVFTAMWSTMPADRKLQYVSTRDVGVFAARAISDPQGWDRKALALAGADMTYAEGKKTFQEVTGEEMPQTWQIVGKGMIWAIPNLRTMFEFFEKEGYGADIPALKKIEPGLQDFPTWLRESSGWKK